MKIKKILSLIIAIVMVISIAGCRDSQTQKNSFDQDEEASLLEASLLEEIDNINDAKDEENEYLDNEQEVTDSTVTDMSSEGPMTVTKKPKYKENLYPDYVLEVTDTTVTYMSTDGPVTVTKKPKKVVVLINSLLDLWYMAGGEAIARVDGETNVPKEAINITALGPMNGVSLEQLIALEPDLVIISSTVSTQIDMIPILKEMDIEYASISGHFTPYEAFQKNLYLFTRIMEREDIFDSEIAKITREVDEIINKVKAVEEKPSVVILFSSTSRVQCELPTSLTGEMIDLLGVKNIVADAQIEGANRVDFSMERLVERDPDYVLITTMGDVDKCKERIEKDIVANEAWGSLTAVKEGRVYYLPKDMFTYRPNSRYPEAFKELGKLVYPEVFKGE